jgi:hypothetical protein
VKLKGGPKVRANATNVFIDMGSVRSINMGYTDGADVYIGDVSSQVYEFLRRPRPCIFLNFHGIDWKGNENYAHWKLGQVINRPEDLAAALERAGDLQPQFVEAQRRAFERSIDPGPEPASLRQARAIMEFAYSQRPESGAALTAATLSAAAPSQLYREPNHRWQPSPAE